MENDFLSFSNDPEILSAIKSNYILYSNKIQKMNSFIIKPERNLVVTATSIYIFQNKKLKKILKFEDIKGITLSTMSNEFIIHRINQYDIHYLCSDKIRLICSLIKAYEKCMKTPITLCEIPEKSLKPYATTKKEKKKDINASRMDKNRIIDTQTFLIDNDKDIKFAKRSLTINPNVNNIFNLNDTNNNNLNVINEEDNINIIYTNNNSTNRIDENDFKYIDIIGRGKMSKIYLVENTMGKKYYAVKSINKNKIGKYDKNNIEKILKNINNEFVINITLCFETQEKIYFYYEHIQNEDLFYYINNNSNENNVTINEEKIKFYIASIILALEHLHKNEITFRNITPKNILITKDGYIKLTPFSLEHFFNLKKEIEKNEYTSPEVLNNEIKISSDFWNLGIIIFEMIFGIPPFYSLDENNLIEVIMKNELKFPEKKISENLKDLIEKLLKKNWEERLGNDGDFNKIKNHPFFQDFNFDDLINKKMESPYKPNFENNLKNNTFYEIYNDEDLMKIELMDLS